MTTAVDEELAEGLSQARKKPRHFALVAKGPTPLKLIVRKKPIRDGELAKAKTEAKGNATVRGVCVFDGTEFEFQVVDQDPGIAPVKLKALISEQADMTVKVRFQVVPQLADVGEEEEQEGEQTSQETTTGATNDAVDPSKQKLIDALKAIAGRMQEAITTQPDRSGDVLAAAGLVKSSLGADNIPAATAAFQALAELIQELLGADAEQEAAEQEAEDYLLGSLLPDQEEEEESSETEAEQETEIPIPPPPPVLSEKELSTPQPPPPGSDSPSVGDRLRWQDAKEQVDANLSVLQAKLRETGDPDFQAIAEYGFHGITGKLQVGLRVALMEFDRASSADREKCKQKALGIVRQYQEFLSTNRLVQLVDENIYDVKVNAREILGSALNVLETSLNAE